MAAGGTILNNSGLRVMGILQCTRAIGDKDLQPYGVIATPDVHSIARTGQEEFLVLATDGLWDVMSNEVGGVGGRARLVTRGGLLLWQACACRLPVSNWHVFNPPVALPAARCCRCVAAGGV